MSVFLERIRAFAQERGISLRKISIDAGVSDAYMSNSLKKGSNPSIDFVSKIIDNYPELNPFWLLTGKGNMIIPPNMVAEEIENYRISKTIDEIIDDKIDVKLKTLRSKIQEMIAQEIEREREALKEIQFSKDKESDR